MPLKPAKRLFVAMVAALALAAGATVRAQGAAATHPLDGLTAAEYVDVVAILKADGRAGDKARYPLIALEEPPKAQVKAWAPGQPVPRRATVVVNEGGKSFEGLVDIAGRKVLSWGRARGEPMLMAEEFGGATEAVLSDARMLSGLKKRGIAPAAVYCLPLTAGNFGVKADNRRRILKVPCFMKPDPASATGKSNWWARPVEGLLAVVDLRDNKVIDVVDTGVVPVPADGWGYTAAEMEKRAGPLRAALNPAELSQPAGPSFKVEGSMVQWDMWRFHWRVDKRPGVVVSAVEARDGNRWRSVLYQAHVSEVFVPYMDPDRGWYFRTYMDSGEYGFGIFLSPLRPGLDCPRHAKLFSATMHGDDGAPVESPAVVCIFERNIGDPAWRHFEYFAQAPDKPVPAEGRPATELVVRSASEVGNYDYLVDYIFQQDGTIRIALGATGLDAVKGVRSQSMADASAARDTRYGSLIAPGLVAPNHDHYFNFRLDMDIDGVANDFMKGRLVRTAVPAAAGVPRRSMWSVEHDMPRTERAARSNMNPAAPAMYHFVNHGAPGPLGHQPGYKLMPQGSYAYSMLTDDDWPMKRNAYIRHQLYVTPYDPGQRYAGGKYAFQSDGGDTLEAWTKKNRSIANTDLVAWYTVGFHHVPRAEDWPVMPTHWFGFSLMPFNFFGHNPATNLQGPDAGR
jgi:primary-amine oxidase